MARPNGLSGYKNKPCEVDPDKLHRWTTWEKIVDGRYMKLTICKQCGKQP